MKGSYKTSAPMGVVKVIYFVAMYGPGEPLPVIVMDVRDLAELVGDGFSLDRFVSEVPMLGATVERLEGDEVSVEFFPNRPDLFSVEGVARAYSRFSGRSDSQQERYRIEGPSGMDLNVSPDVADVRPIIGAALLKDVRIDERALVSLMNLQEKLHITLGRKRKKVAIGIHDAAPIRPPFAYGSYRPQDISFVPLGKDGEWTLERILNEHEKGTAYAWTLDGLDRYPVITDSIGQVLSFPPIINGELTRVTTDSLASSTVCSNWSHVSLQVAVMFPTSSLMIVNIASRALVRILPIASHTVRQMFCKASPNADQSPLISAANASMA